MRTFFSSCLHSPTRGGLPESIARLEGGAGLCSAPPLNRGEDYPRAAVTDESQLGPARGGGEGPAPPHPGESQLAAHRHEGGGRGEHTPTHPRRAPPPAQRPALSPRRPTLLGCRRQRNGTKRSGCGMDTAEQRAVGCGPQLGEATKAACRRERPVPSKRRPLDEAARLFERQRAVVASPIGR